MASTPEGRVKAAVKKLLKDYGVWFFMPIGGPFARMGVPDFSCMAPGGKAFFIETKAPGKLRTLTANQSNCHDEIRSVGGVVLVIDDVAPLKEYLDGI